MRKWMVVYESKAKEHVQGIHHNWQCYVDRFWDKEEAIKYYNLLLEPDSNFERRNIVLSEVLSVGFPS